MFITLEGGEGVGKTTQMKLLREQLPKLVPKRTFVFTREPGGTPFADKIREVILSDEAKGSDGKAMFGLFAAARAEHLAQIVMPSLKRGSVVISDRYVAATYAYQVCAQDNPISSALFDEYYKDLEARPDLTVILDIDPEISQARIKDRMGQTQNHFDTRPLEFHQRLQRGYHDFGRNYSNDTHNVVFVNAGQTVEEVHDDIVEQMWPFLI